MIQKRILVSPRTLTIRQSQFSPQNYPWRPERKLLVLQGSIVYLGPTSAISCSLAACSPSTVRVWYLWHHHHHHSLWYHGTCGRSMTHGDSTCDLPAGTTHTHTHTTGWTLGTHMSRPSSHSPDRSKAYFADFLLTSSSRLTVSLQCGIQWTKVDVVGEV